MLRCLLLSRQKQANKPLAERQHIPGLLPRLSHDVGQMADRCVTIDGEGGGGLPKKGRYGCAGPGIRGQFLPGH